LRCRGGAFCPGREPPGKLAWAAANPTGKRVAQKVCDSSFPLFSDMYFTRRIEMLKLVRNRKGLRNRKGQGLVEYALIIAGVALIGIVGITMFGHKVADLIGTVAYILPGAHTDDNNPIVAGHLIETDNLGGANGNAIEISLPGIQQDIGTDRINEMMLGGSGAQDSPAVVETNSNGGG
jgi:hypothetical protein